MRTTFKRLLIAAGLLLAVFVGWLAWQLIASSGPITVSPQTTVLTEPLAADGLPDYAQYLLDEMSDGVTPQNNGAIPFLQAMWPADMNPEQQAAVCEELGMDLPAQPGMSEPYSDKTLKSDIEAWLVESDEPPDDELEPEGGASPKEVLIDYAGSYAWTAEQIPPLADWVKRNESAFKLLQEAAAKSDFYLPSPSLLLDPNASLVSQVLPTVLTIRSAERCLAFRAYFYIGEGDLDAAWRDCRTMYVLARKPPRQSLVGELVSIACEGVAHEPMKRILDDPELSTELAKEIHEFLREQPPRRAMARVIDRYERLIGATAILQMAGLRESKCPTGCDPMGDRGPVTQLLAGAAMDWEHILEIVNGWYDRLVEALQQPTWQERQDAVAALDAELTKLTAGPGALGLFSRNGRSEQMANVLSSLLLPAISAALSAEDRANSLLQLQQTAAALAVYHGEQGEYPTELAALQPEYLDKLPVDVYRAKPLVYQKTARGYLLYSLGPNETDDGGSSSSLMRYQGYEAPQNNEALNRAVCELLGEPALLEGEAEPGQDDPVNWLLNQIPQQADDISIRLPLPRIGLPATSPGETD